MRQLQPFLSSPGRAREEPRRRRRTGGEGREGILGLRGGMDRAGHNMTWDNMTCEIEDRTYSRT